MAASVRVVGLVSGSVRSVGSVPGIGVGLLEWERAAIRHWRCPFHE